MLILPKHLNDTVITIPKLLEATPLRERRGGEELGGAGRQHKNHRAVQADTRPLKATQAPFTHAWLSVFGFTSLFYLRIETGDE